MRTFLDINALSDMAFNLAKVEVVGSNPIARSNHWRISNTLPSELSANSGRFRQNKAKTARPSWAISGQRVPGPFAWSAGDG